MKLIILIVFAWLMIFFNAFASDSLVMNNLPEPDKSIKIGLLIQDNNSVEAIFSTKRSGRCLAVSDFDNDGDLDIIISHVDKPGTSALLRNDGGNGNHWIGLTLKGKDGPASAIGAKVTVTAGGKKQVLVNQWATSYLANNDPRMHIGLGQQKVVDQFEVSWSDGKKEIFKNIAIDKYSVIIQGKGIVVK